MDDLRDRFASLDRIPVPDLRSDIDHRVADAAAASRVQGQVTWRTERAPRRLSPMLVMLLLSLLLALALALVTVGSRLPNLWTSVVPVAPVGAFVSTGSMIHSGCSWCHAVVLNDGRVLVLGGPTGQIYNPATWAFAAAEGLPPPGPLVLLDDGRVLVTSMNEIALYDPATGTSELIENPFSVGVAAVRLADGRVLILGTDPAGQGPGSAVTFDPKTDTLSATGGTIAELQSDVRLVPLNDGRVLVVGGSSDARSAELYDPATGTFSATGSMNFPRGGFTATRLADGRVLIVGGSSDTQTHASAEIYDPASGTFTLTGSMEMPRFWHAAALLPDGRVLVVGGSPGGVRVDAGTFTEIYDPETGRFIRGPVTNQPRVAATAVTLSSGVLVLGHYPGNGGGGNAAASRTAELFTLDPVEPPVGCCLDNPGFISVSASAEHAAARRAVLVVPAGALDGAVGASVSIDLDWPGGGTGKLSELSIPDCTEGCSIPLGLSVGSSSVRQDAVVTAAVGIAYEGPPPPQASGIAVVIDAND